MESNNSEEYGSKLLGAQTHIWNHIFSFIKSMSLKCTVDLGIPDAIQNYGQPMPLSKLIVSLQIHLNKTHCIQRLMRILTHSGFFSQQNNQIEDELEVSYALTDASMLLLKDNPMTLTPFLFAMLDPILTRPWYQLPTWFKTDDVTSFEMTHGMSMWDYLGVEPRFSHFLNDVIASNTPFVTSIVFECKGVFDGLESLVDVGGGTGTMAKAIANLFPQLQCNVFDLPHVVASFQGSKNLKYVGGDMFESIPSADAILLKWILHEWGDKECVKIPKKCKEATTSNKEKKGKVIIMDIIVGNEKGDDKSIETKLFFDMMMMTLLNAKERDEEEWAELIFSAGFSDYKITSALGLRSLIEIYP